MKRNMRRSGEDERWREGLPIENYGKKEQKYWLDNTLSDPHPWTAGNKEEEHMSNSHNNNDKNNCVMYFVKSRKNNFSKTWQNCLLFINKKAKNVGVPCKILLFGAK